MKIINPKEIEKRSMEIIGKEIGRLDCTSKEAKIIKRVIHATADLEFAKLTIISPEAVESGLKALKSGAKIVTDVTMIKAGINKKKLEKLGGEVRCFISDQDVANKAEKLGITRSMMAMRKAVKDKKNRFFVIGNAPTALFELIRLIKEERAEVDLIIGTPVGFVGAAEAKKELERLNLPFITVRGRKGGSTVAVAITNALLYMIEE